MKKTGVFATKKEIEHLQKFVKESSETPIILVGGLDVAEEARKRLKEECHKIALKHELPEIKGYYGILEDGEFVTT